MTSECLRKTFEVCVIPAEAKGWRVEINKQCKRKELRPSVHSEWFKTKSEAMREFRRIKRKC